MLPSFAKLVFIVKQAQLFNDVVHYEVGVNLRLIRHVFLVGVAQLADLVDVKTLVWVDFEHADYEAAQLLAVLLAQWREISLRYTLKQLVQIQILFVRRPERTSECA